MSEATTLEPRQLAGGGALSWLRRNPALACLAVALAASGALLITLGSHLVFYGDDWNLVLGRHGLSAGAFLDPHNGHLIAAVVVIYKLLLATFGMSSPLPFHVVSTLVYLTAAVLLFVYCRRRVGDWLALAGTSVILFFGAAAGDMLSPFQMFFSGSIAAGIGALLALDRDDRRGDVIACALLVVSISFGEVGIAFSVGALIRLALSPRTLVPRLYVVLVPMALYALWWLGWGHTAPNSLSFSNMATTPSYMLTAVAAAGGALLGIASGSNQVPSPTGQQWPPIVLVAAAALGLWRVRRLGYIPRGVWVVLAVGLTFWTLAGFNQLYGLRPADDSRFIYPGGVFVLLIASELLRGVRVGGRAILAVVVATALAVASNLVWLSDSYRSFARPASEQSQLELRALEIAGPLRPSFVVGPAPFFFNIHAGSYLAAVQAWGSPAYSEAELATRPEADRRAADQTLGAALGLRLKPGGFTNPPCHEVLASPSGSDLVQATPGKVTLSSSASVRVKLGRFADELPIDVGSLQRGSVATLDIPTDGSARPWHLGLVGRGEVRVCGPNIS